MTKLRLHAFLAVVFLSAGCSPPPPVVVTTPTTDTLSPLMGRTVTLEGEVVSTKAGLILKNSGPAILLEYWGAADATWPASGTQVQVTGTLRAEKDPRSQQYVRFHLDHPRARIVEKVAR